MARRILELFKTILIIVLVLNILLLTLLALPASITKNFALPDALTKVLGLPTKDNLPTVDVQQLSAQTKPILISLQQEQGRATIRRDATALALAYERFSGFFATALTTAAEPESYRGWDFLSCPGVLFSYPGSIPAQALSQWLSQADGMVLDHAAQYLLCAEGETVYLYTVKGEQIHRYSTAVSFTELSAQLSQYSSDGSLLAAEMGESTLSPLTLWESAIYLPAYSAANPMTETLSDKIATHLDFNPYGVGTYKDPNGNTVYTESNRSLVISPAGGVTLSATEGNTRFLAAGSAPADLIRTAETLLAELYDMASPDAATLYLCAYEEEESLIHCSFCQVVGGVPVYPACAEMTFRGQELISLSCTLRILHKTGGTFSLMPLNQAAAIAQRGDLLLPAYQMTPSGISAGWFAQ